MRREFGEKLDAERARKHDVILQLLFDEADAIAILLWAMETRGGVR